MGSRVVDRDDGFRHTGPYTRIGRLARARRSLELALQLGGDFDISDNWFVNVDVRYIDIDTEAELNGANLATVEIDPWVFGLNLGWRF